MKKQLFKSLIFLTILTGYANSTIAKEAISLSGTWFFRLDADKIGHTEKWYTQQLEDTVTLPGTTDENKKGVFKDESAVDRLSRVWYWKGPAWYQKQVTIPKSWSGKKITLFFERGKDICVWVDDTFCGWENTLSAAQVFDVTSVMSPGKHTITIVVDNSKLPPVGPAHAVDERTQTNWNGIVGKMELRAADAVWLDDIQVYPNAAKKEAKVRAVIGNITGQPFAGQISVECESYNVDNPATFKGQTVKVKGDAKESVVEFVYKPGDGVPLWDEFNPAMLKLTLRLETKAGAEEYSNERSVNFGMRDFTKDRNRFMVNGKCVFLRGRLDCANYPLTGYPPMDKAEWKRILSITKQWGINHYRFHSWCPPEAAFEAADELGVYFQAELPNKRGRFLEEESLEAAYWNIDRMDVESTETKVSHFDYTKREGELIFKDFGNHPSFVMFTLGNELGRNKGMFELVDHFRKTDPRRLYAQGSGNMHWNPSLPAGDDFWVTAKVDNARTKPLRGSFFILDYPNAPVETYPPSTLFDFSKSIEGVEVPMVGHETGQYQVYPDYRDIPEFTGVTRARNYEIFRERLKEAGMLDQAHDFVRASGALAAICYREDIEMALRTAGMGGIQLLDIQDFPGQGTALVGMLNDFMESKGVIEPEKWRQFCCETVPLLRMKKYTWTTDETFIARAQVAHYGPADIEDAIVTWTVTDSKGKRIAGDAFDKVTIKQGRVFDVDMFAMELNKVDAPQKLTITLAIEGTKYRNDYNIWVYPPKVDTKARRGVLVADSFQDEKTQRHLANGGKVLLLPKLDKLPYSVKGGFQCEFWSPMFAAAAEKRGVEPPPGTLGFLCDPKHPIFAEFPTDFHVDWQWWHLLKNSRPIKFDETADDFRPIVQMVDNFVRNSKLGLIAETKVGKGEMLICAIDLLGLQDKPEARQLLHSLLQYAGSGKFAPKKEIDVELLNKLFPKPGQAGRWSKEKANEWYDKQNWPCGFNYVPANTVSYTEMWMPYCFDSKLIDKELALAEDVGFNCLRVVLPFVVWEHDPEAFKKRLNTFLDVCDKRGFGVMFTLFDDCGEVTDPTYGKQPDVVKGWYANAWSSSPGHSMVRDPKTWPRLERYVKDVIGTFKDDPRVWVWDLYNEPTNSGMGNISLGLVKKVFRWARDINPKAPLTVASWNGNKELNAIANDYSDIITFHNYGNADRVAKNIKTLKALGRPVINTEWLCRHRDSKVEACLPLFARENVGCMHWGLVNGRSQTHLHWGWRPGRGEPEVWQHDLYHGDHTPYNEDEIALFGKLIGQGKKK